MTEDLNTEAMSMPLAPSEIDIEHHLPAGWGEGFSGRLLFWIAVLFSSFQIYTAIYAPLATQVQRALHVGFLILVAARSADVIPQAGPRGPRHRALSLDLLF